MIGRAWLRMSSWAGLLTYEVDVVCETKARFRIVSAEPIRVSRTRTILPGVPTLVPKHAVTFRSTVNTNLQRTV